MFKIVHMKKLKQTYIKTLGNKKRRNATKPGFQRFNQVLIWQE